MIALASKAEIPDAPGHKLGPWQAELQKCIRQQPLISTHASLAGVSRLTIRPRTLFMGIGLCTRRELSRELPADVLGMLLPAELVRRAVQATETVVLLADSHALTNGFRREEVMAYAAEVERTIHRLASALPLRLTVVRAVDLHARKSYRRLLCEVQRRASDDHPYITRQLADMAYFHRRFTQPLLKVGWQDAGAARWDERAFDNRYRRHFSDGIGFIYCKPGRCLNDKALTATPYVTYMPHQRVRLDAAEDLQAKLAQAKALLRPDTVRGVKKHVGLIARALRQLDSFHGAPEERLQALFSTL